MTLDLRTNHSLLLVCSLLIQDFLLCLYLFLFKELLTLFYDLVRLAAP